jgi:hypothetical protein
MVPSGATGYVQVCDGFANKKIKELITEREEIHYDQHEDEWRRGKFSVSDRRVLLAHWVLEAYNELHEKYSHLIVKGFEQVGLSLNPNGRDDWKLKIRDLPGIAYSFKVQFRKLILRSCRYRSRRLRKTSSFTSSLFDRINSSSFSSIPR